MTKIALVVCAALALAACGGSDTGDAPVATPPHVWELYEISETTVTCGYGASVTLLPAEPPHLTIHCHWDCIETYPAVARRIDYVFKRDADASPWRLFCAWVEYGGDACPDPSTEQIFCQP